MLDYKDERTTMNYIEQIKNYIPYNEQEKVDKDFALKHIEESSNILTRDDEIAHITASSWIVNKEHTKVLLIYHNIYKSWSWTGGHADGEENLLHVAIKEAMEETGIEKFTPVSEDIFSIENLCVNGHIKRGKYISSHLHINVSYLLEADDKAPLKIKEDENAGVKWFTLEEALIVPNEEWMVENIYKKLNEKLSKI